MSMAHDVMLTLVARALARHHAATPAIEPDDLAIQAQLSAAHAVCAIGEVLPTLDAETADVLGFEWRIVTRKVKNGVAR